MRARGHWIRGLIGLAIATSSACSVPPERAVLDRFFAAARLRDNTVLRELATVAFEPLEQGMVVDFEITKVTPEHAGSKEVQVRASVRLPDGRLSDKTLFITLHRSSVTSDTLTPSRWIVTGIGGN